MNDLLEQVREWIGRRVAEGFDADSEILAASVEHFSDACDVKKLRPLAARCTAEAVTDHRSRQAHWPDTTDCDRLDAAFAELAAAGLNARQNFGCCAACSQADAAVDLDESTGQWGFAFYSRQDTEDAAETGRLLVSFGAAERGQRAACAVGQRVVAAFRRAGLKADWDGDPRHRIAILGLDWKRRR